VVVDKVFPLAEASQAHAHMESNANTGKIILKVAELGRDEL
jgi:NADPH:quinone reductase-like Zn-dependent oxidoreductase